MAKGKFPLPTVWGAGVAVLLVNPYVGYFVNKCNQKKKGVQVAVHRNYHPVVFYCKITGFCSAASGQL